MNPQRKSIQNPGRGIPHKSIACCGDLLPPLCLFHVFKGEEHDVPLIGEKTEAWRNELPCPKLHSLKVARSWLKVTVKGLYQSKEGSCYVPILQIRNGRP